MALLSKLGLGRDKNIGHWQAVSSVSNLEYGVFTVTAMKELEDGEWVVEVKVVTLPREQAPVAAPEPVQAAPARKPKPRKPRARK